MEIKVYATLRAIVNEPSGHLTGVSEVTVEQMLGPLFNVYPDLRPELYKGRDELHPAIHILVNGQNIRYLDGIDTILTENDDIRIFPQVGGGCQ